jgi:formylglycine-generating enzyme required for sulfatase activity
LCAQQVISTSEDSLVCSSGTLSGISPGTVGIVIGHDEVGGQVVEVVVAKFRVVSAGRREFTAEILDRSVDYPLIAGQSIRLLNQPPIGAESSQTTTEEKIQNAQKLIREGQYERALSVYLALSKEPGDTSTFANEIEATRRLVTERENLKRNAEEQRQRLERIKRELPEYRLLVSKFSRDLPEEALKYQTLICEVDSGPAAKEQLRELQFEVERRKLPLTYYPEDVVELASSFPERSKAIVDTARSNEEKRVRESAWNSFMEHLRLGSFHRAGRTGQEYLKNGGEVARILEATEDLFQKGLVDGAIAVTESIETRQLVEPAIDASLERYRAYKRVEEMVRIPAGPVHVGDKSGSYRPTDKIHLPEFWIDKYEVTNLQYQRFLVATGHRPPKTWDGTNYPLGQSLHPVLGVTLEDAKAYARWAGKRLPSDEEWDRAAKGELELAYPWGNEFSPARSNSGSAGAEPVLNRAEGASTFGVMHMIGNAIELTRNGLGRGGSYLTPNQASALKIPRIQTGKSGASDAGFRCVR